MTMKMAKVRDCNATDGIISKPFDIEILLSKIKELLDKAHFVVQNTNRLFEKFGKEDRKGSQ